MLAEDEVADTIASITKGKRALKGGADGSDIMLYDAIVILDSDDGCCWTRTTSGR